MNERGFSLAEMLVSTAIAAFGLAGVAAMIGHGVQLQAGARTGTVSASLAVSELERLRALPSNSVERTNGGSLTANTANHFAIRGTTTLRWVVADGPACGPVVWAGPVPIVECARTVTVIAVPNNPLAGSTTVSGMLWR